MKKSVLLNSSIYEDNRMEGLPGESARDLPLDFVKGVLVIVMVIYHVINYFSTAGYAALAHVRFVTGSFIFISGYIISTFYEKRYSIDRADVSRRLFIRGMKLLLVFTVLNVVINLVGIGNPRKAPPDIEQYLENLTMIYTWGNRRLMAFQILLPISYLLMLAPTFLYFRGHRKVLVITTLVIVSYFSLLDIDSENIGLGMVGLVGLSVGMAMNELESPFEVRNRIIMFGGLAICIFLMPYLNENLMAYSLGILVILKLLYDFANTVNLRRRISRAIILYGRYTLVCYIVQIVFLQGLLRLLGGQRWGLGHQTASICAITSVFLLGLCVLIEVLRARHEFFDRVYNSIFS